MSAETDGIRPRKKKAIRLDHHFYRSARVANDAANHVHPLLSALVSFCKPPLAGLLDFIRNAVEEWFERVCHAALLEGVNDVLVGR